MSQNFTDDCYASTHVRATDLQAFENNFAALKSSFSGSSAPSNAVAGMLWYDTSTGFLKVRNTNNTTWISIYDVVNDVVPSNKVVLASLINGILTADATGRAKMADLFVTNAKINDVSGTKITDNTISTAKIQNNVVTPSKMAAGSSYLWQWSSDKVTDLDANETGVVLSRVTNGTYKVWQRAYLYIPSGAKYVVLGVRASAQNYPANWRINVNGTAGSVAQPTYNAGINNAYGSPLDISSQAGAWRLCTIELAGAGGTPGAVFSVVAVSFTVTWYGA